MYIMPFGHQNISVSSGTNAPSNRLIIIRGDDYSSAENRSIDWTDTGSVWPDLTSGSISFTAKKNTRDSTLTSTGSVIVATGANKQVRAEPTHAETTGLKVGDDWLYDVQVTLPSGSFITLVHGNLSIVEDYAIPN
jgi:hypothetical protein